MKKLIIVLAVGIIAIQAVATTNCPTGTELKSGTCAKDTSRSCYAENCCSGKEYKLNCADSFPFVCSVECK